MRLPDANQWERLPTQPGWRLTVLSQGLEPSHAFGKGSQQGKVRWCQWLFLQACWRLGSERSAAEDFVQETLMPACKGQDPLKAAPSRGWLAGILRQAFARLSRIESEAES